MRYYFALYILIFIALGCKKGRKPTTWDTDLYVPIAHGSLNIEDLLKNNVYSSNSDSSLTIHVKRDLHTLDFNELFEVPDTTILDTFVVPISIPLTFNPGQVFINDPEQNELHLDGAELTDLWIDNAQVSYEIQSTIQGDIQYTYSIPSALDEQGDPFVKNIFVSAAPQGGRTTVTGTLDLSGYNIDLRGIGSDRYNQLETTIQVKVDDFNDGPVQVSNLDTIYVLNTIENVTFEYAKGYFGTYSYSFGPESLHTNAFDFITSGDFDLEGISADLIMVNGIGMDGSFALNSLSASNSITGNDIPLSASVIGQTYDLNRALEVNGIITPTQTILSLNSNNSNLDQLLEQQPDSLSASIDLELNPLGNISGHNDFISIHSPFKMELDADIPCSIEIDSLKMIDTLTLDISEAYRVKNGSLIIDIENGFPISQYVGLKILDQNEQVFNTLSNLEEIPPAAMNNNVVSQPGTRTITIQLESTDLQELINSKKIILEFMLDTDGMVDLYETNYLNYHIKGLFNNTVTIE